MAAPDSSIDYDGRRRLFSLPFGLAPALPPDKLDIYLGELGVTSEVFFFRRPDGGGPGDEAEFDPGPAQGRRIREIPQVGRPGLILLPLGTRHPAAIIDLAAGQEDAVGRKVWAALPVAAGEDAATIARRLAATMRWDPDARAVSALPQPVLTDESLLALWAPDGAPATGLLAAPLPGVLSPGGDTAAHVLATSPDRRDGELDRHLLRAPALGLVRFERYRHVVRDGAALQLRQPSAAGRLSLNVLPAGSAPAPDTSPLLADNRLVFENVAAADAVELLHPLLVSQLFRFPDLAGVAPLRPAAVAQLSWLLRSWVAYLRHLRPTLRPADPDPLPGLPAAQVAPFRLGRTATRAEITALRTSVLTDATATASLLGYARDFYVPLLCGGTWEELGASIPAAAGQEPRTGDPVGHAILEGLPRASDTWLIAFAGAPLARPAPAYVPPAGPAAPTPGDIARSGFSTFELEALHLAGATSALFPGTSSPADPDALRPVDLSQFAGHSPGRYAWLRLLDKRPPKQEYTTFDWLMEVVKGANRWLAQPARVDFAACDGHPLAGPLGWERFATATAARTAMTALRAQSVGGRALAGASVKWWVDNTNLVSGGQWPVVKLGPGAALADPGPVNPYRSATTTHHPVLEQSVSGFDAFDLDAVLQARTFVADGKNPALGAGTVHPGLFLALAERESYRALGSDDRTFSRPDGLLDHRLGPPRRQQWLVGGVPALTGINDTAARNNWLVFPYGLDIFNHADPTKPCDVLTAAACAPATTAQFNARLSAFAAEGILPADFLPSRGAQRFIANRLQAVRRPADGRLCQSRLSRRLQPLGLTLQMAEFQSRHRRLHTADGSPGGWQQVDELVDVVLPDPGPTANSPERLAFIAYYALVYLSFNVLRETWNQWVRAAKLNKDPAETVGAFLLRAERASTPLGPLAPGEPGDRRVEGQRGNTTFFAVSLDHYLRLDFPTGSADVIDPAPRTW